MAEMTPDDLLARIDQYLDQTLDEEAVAELQQQLKQDSNARAVFVRMATAHRVWHEWATFESELERSQVSQPDTEESRRLDDEVWQSILEDSIAAKKRAEAQAKAEQMLEEDQRRRMRVRRSESSHEPSKHGISIVIPRYAAWAAIAACVLVAGLIAYNSSNNAPDDAHPPLAVPDHPSNETPDTPPAIAPLHLATLEAAQRVAWSQAHLKPAADGTMPPGRYVLERGAASVVMSRGASLLVQAPARFELLDDNRIKLESGRLVARVPGRAAGFTIEANDLRIIDIGTEFGVDVDRAGEVLASTFDGMVVMRESKGQGDGVMLAAGEAVVVERGQSLAAVEKLDKLPADKVFARTLDEASDPAFAYERAILADKPLVYWRCEELSDGKVLNEANAEALHAKVLGPMQLGTGLFGGAGLFNGDASVQSGLISTEPVLQKGVMGAYTVEGWFKPDRIHRGTILALFTDAQEELEYPVEVNVDMQAIITEERELIADKIRFRFTQLIPNAEQERLVTAIDEHVAYQPNQWGHVVAVHEPGQTRLYLNGKLVQQAEYDTSDSPQNTHPLQLAVGNTGVGVQLNRSNFRTFSGLIDEVAVYDHALSEEQIKNHYSLGQPQE